MYKVGILGLGNMGSAILEGLLQFSNLKAKDIICSHPKTKVQTACLKNYKVKCISSNSELLKKADMVIVCVKPQIIAKVLHDLDQNHCFNHKPLLISCAAGFSSESILNTLSKDTQKYMHQNIVRFMPNMPIKVGRGVNVFSFSEKIKLKHKNLILKTFQNLGQNIELNENQFDAATGLCGSGPAFIYTMMDACIDAGVKVGLSRKVAKDMVKQTFLGASTLIDKTGKHPGQLKDLITSPAGTAITGIYTLEKGGIRHTLIEAIEAATNRAHDLNRS